jgi:rod shape determining protein RodA
VTVLTNYTSSIQPTALSPMQLNGVDSKEKSTLWRKSDLFVPFLGLVLSGIGLLYLDSAAPNSSFFVKQMIFMFAGLVAYTAMFLIPYIVMMRFALWFYAAGILSLIAVMFLGTEVNGAKSWFTLGPVRIQPSEFMKLGLLLFMSQYLAYYDNYKRLGGLLFTLGFLAVPFLIVLKQPDLGTATVFLPMFFAALWAAGARKKHLALVAIGGILLAVVGYQFVMKDYQKKRLDAWLAPQQYSNSFAYQTNQARIAIGSGELTGKGWKQGTHHRLKYLPERHTDMIFAVISEEGGFIASSAVLLLFMALLGRGLWIAHQTSDLSGRVIAVGVSVLIMGQAMINIAVCNGMMPATGIALPFMSYGGSSMVSSWMALGLLSNVAARRKIHVGPDKFST